MILVHEDDRFKYLILLGIHENTCDKAIDHVLEYDICDVTVRLPIARKGVILLIRQRSFTSAVLDPCTCLPDFCAQVVAAIVVWASQRYHRSK
jgi:hypothetical protein